ncbi:hypothetical protein [Actinocrispum wychmicini]|uniref:Excreted virulence factor EspC (Type VII ESX diderm) n=1 Tax=Actinocrispum wychmicini TaxID=1213861 RepID=A0A4V2S836_9PSEU|nr:hypothetical protein [Actinocrispum wychmicini]TCO62310.1 hypothetical protein EV192_102447 [Actinocrispum wychmicini]
MGTVDVRPESIHLAAQKVDGAGQDWGEAVGRLTADMNGIGDPYGGDELGTALKDMYEIIGPTALEYFAETGFCVIETADAMNQMATAYTTVERDNTAQANKVRQIMESLGDV